MFEGAGAVMGWDYAYRPLNEGEIVLATDEVQNDDGTWKLAVGGVGMPAPDPSYTLHRIYRRRKAPK